MRSPFDRKARSSGPSNREVQSIRRRTNQGPGIEKADQRAHSTLPKDGSEELTGYPLLPEGPPTDARHPARKGETDAARQRADEAHSRSTNAAVNAAHGAAESANTNAGARLSRADGGAVPGTTRVEHFQAQHLCLATNITNSTVTYTVGSGYKNLALAYVLDGAEGWVPLPTVGTGSIYVVANRETTFAIRNTRTTEERVRARLWEDPNQ